LSDNDCLFPACTPENTLTIWRVAGSSFLDKRCGGGVYSRIMPATTSVFCAAATRPLLKDHRTVCEQSGHSRPCRVGPGNFTPERRYSPAKCFGARRGAITGHPDPKHISTSYAERQNLSLRMHMRRFTRLTNAFSKKVENHAAAVSLHAMYYNFVHIH
jgi:hypothetical protein